MIFTAGTSSETFIIKVTVPLSVPENLEGKASSLSAFLKQRCKYEIQTHRYGSQGQVKCVWMECHPSSGKAEGLALEEVEKRQRK